MKHIESIQSEYAAGDLSRLLVSDADATASAALSRLLHDWTGCAIPQTSDLPQSEVEELVPLCLSILRSHWTTPLTALGDGTTPMSLADLLRQLIGDRVDGNEALGIPAANADIPTAVSQLRDRKIGGADVADGMSLGRILGDSTLGITEITDDTEGWTLNRNTVSIFNTFANLKKLVLNCRESNYPILDNHSAIEEIYVNGLVSAHTLSHHTNTFNNLPNLKKLEANNLEEFTTEWQGPDFIQNVGCERLSFPKFKRFSAGNGSGFVNSCPNLREFELPSSESLAVYINIHLIYNCQALEKVVLNKVGYYNGSDSIFNESGYANLVHLELGHNGDLVDNNIDLRNWTATNVLSKPDFLSNFKTYIANRLQGGYAVGTGPTLTLSKAVRDAIQKDPQIIDIIVTSKGWTISPAPSV